MIDPQKFMMRELRKEFLIRYYGDTSLEIKEDIKRQFEQWLEEQDLLEGTIIKVEK